MTPRERDERRVTVRLPAVLAAKMDGAVKARRQEPGSWKFSMNDLMVEALRVFLDGGENRPAAPVVRKQLFDEAGGSRLFPDSPRFDPTKIPGVTKGMPVGGNKTEEAPSLWLPLLKRFALRGDVGDEEFREKVGVGFKTPPKWTSWTLDMRAAWLDENHPLEAE